MKYKSKPNSYVSFAHPVYIICPKCQFKLLDPHEPKSYPGLASWTIFSYPCDYCNGWSVPAIPPCELGL